MVETVLNAVGKTDKKKIPTLVKHPNEELFLKKNMSGFCMTYKQRSLTASDK